MTDGSAPEQKSINPIRRIKEKLVERFKPAPAQATEKDAPRPKIDDSKIQFDEKGEAIGPFEAAKEPNKYGNYLITDKRTGDIVGVLETPELAQRQANRGNAIEAIREQLGKPT